MHVQWSSARRRAQTHNASAPHTYIQRIRSTRARGGPRRKSRRSMCIATPLCALTRVSAASWNATLREPTATEPLRGRLGAGCSVMRAYRRSVLRRQSLITQFCSDDGPPWCACEATRLFRCTSAGAEKYQFSLRKKGIARQRGEET